MIGGHSGSVIHKVKVRQIPCHPSSKTENVTHWESFEGKGGILELQK